MEFQLSYFKSWEIMLRKCCTQYASKFGKLSNGHRNGKGRFFISIIKKGNAKECSNYCTIAFISHNSKFSSVAQSCLTLRDPMNRSTTGLLAHCQHPELIQTHVHWVRDAIQPSSPLSSPSPPAFNLSQHQGIFQWVSSFPMSQDSVVLAKNRQINKME